MRFVHPKDRSRAVACDFCLISYQELHEVLGWLLENFDPLDFWIGGFDARSFEDCGCDDGEEVWGFSFADEEYQVIFLTRWMGADV